MTRADDDVEFLDAGNDGSLDEELPQPGPGRPRPWIVRVVVVILALIGVVAVVRAATDRPRQPVGHPATRTVAAPSSSSAPVLPAVPTRQPRRNFDEAGVPRLLVPPDCPEAGDGFKACVTSHTLPAAFLTAVRAQFPTAKPIAFTSEVVRPAGAEVVRALWSRQFTAEVGTMSVHVVVSAGVDRDTAVSNSFDDGIRVRTATWYFAGSLSVQVFASAPSGHEPSSAKLDRLARDRRVLLLP